MDSVCIAPDRQVLIRSSKTMRALSMPSFLPEISTKQGSNWMSTSI